MEEITLAAEAGVLPSKFHKIFASKADMETFCALMRDNPWRVVNDRIAVAMEIHHLFKYRNSEQNEQKFNVFAVRPGVFNQCNEMLGQDH